MQCVLCVRPRDATQRPELWRAAESDLLGPEPDESRQLSALDSASCVCVCVYAACVCMLRVCVCYSRISAARRESTHSAAIFK